MSEPLVQLTAFDSPDLPIKLGATTTQNQKLGLHSSAMIV